MKSSAKKVELASVDDLFTTEQERQEADEERVVRIPLTQLHYFKGYPAMQTEVPFTGQPYRFKDDDPKMQETLDSVKKRGVRAPGLVRPDPDGGYEIISGHRRHRASELAGLEDMPVIIRDMTDEEAVIEMVSMSKITIHGIELEMNMLRATDNERISKAIASAGQAADKAMSFTNEAAGLREICRIVRRCFDTAFGPGVGKQVLGDDDVGVALEAYESLVNEASRQRAEFEAKAEVLRAKYSPERSLRE